MRNIATTNLTLSHEGFSIAKIKKEGTQGFKCGGFPCYVGTLTLTMDGIVDNATGSVCASAVVTIEGSGENVLGLGSKVLTEGDSGSVIITLVNSLGAGIEKSLTVKISSAGQNRVKVL